MAISSKPIKLEQVKLISQDYNEKINKKVDAVVGKSLVSDEEIAKLESVKANAEPNTISGIQINSKDITPDPETKKVNITAENLAPDLEGFVQDSELTEKLSEYTKTENLASDPGIVGKFATKDEMANLGTVVGECESEAELESTIESLSVGKGDCVVTTDDKHIHYYNGSEFIDLGGDIDLAPYLKSADADSKFVAKDGDKVLVDPATVTQVDTNKQSIESLQTKVNGLDGALKEEDIVFALDSEVQEQLQAGYTAAQGA